MMPTTYAGVGSATEKPTMTATKDNDDNTADEPKSYPDKVRAQMDTKDTGAIMGRFYQAVSWRED